MQKIEEETKVQREIMNTSAWIQGYYVYTAICSAFDSKDTRYPEKPVEFVDKPQNRLEKNKEVENKIKKQLLNAKIILEQRRESKG